MHPRYQIPGLLTVLLLGGTVFSLYGEFVVNWDDGFEDFTDFSGTSLDDGATANNDGDLVELGFFSNSDDSNLFRGNWIPLTSTTTIGDSSDGTSLGPGAFSFQTKFADADGDATTFFSSSIKDFTVTNGGSGYTSAPTVIISRGTGDSSGSGAVAIATLSGNAVDSVAIKTPLTVGYGGSQYTVDPTVIFSGGGGDGAVATADRYDFTDQNTAVRSVEVTNGGSGYTENFAVTFSGGGVTESDDMATGEAIVSGGSITKIVIRDPGTGYTSIPTVDLSAGDGTSGAGTASFLPQAGQLLAIRVYEKGVATAKEVTNPSRFNTVAAPSTTPGWNAWPSSDTSFTTPNLSADTSLTGLLFQTDAYSISKDLVTSVVDIGSALTADPSASLYTTGNADGGTLTADVSGTPTYSGIMADGLFEDSDDGKLTFVKTGAGTLTLSGAANTYTGDTTISAGGLTLTGSATIANTSNIYLSSGTTLTVSGLSSTFTLDDGQALKGTGSVVGDIIFDSTAGFQDGSTIAPGDTASNFGIGKIDVTGAGTWNAGTTYQWEINDLDGDAGDADANGLGWDYLTFTGALTIAGDASNKILLDVAALDGYNSPYNQLGELGIGNIQRPAKNRSLTDYGSDKFAIVYADGGISGFDADHFEIEYTHFYQQWDDPFHNWSLSLSDDDKTLFLTYSAVPEPSTYVMVGGLLVLPAVTFYRRWKKKKAKAAEEEENLKDA